MTSSDWDAKANELGTSLGVETISIHQFDNPMNSIFISAGNTWRPNQLLQIIGEISGDTLEYRSARGESYKTARRCRNSWMPHWQR